ncbi:MAG: heavy metal translocating P-type ATPase [Proteobacteria bacterium]|nr:heavy metal translocating P-type ATPase [Pseudomonadota bacterium]
MNIRWRVDLCLFGACLCGLLGGGALWLAGAREAAAWSWVACATLAGVALLASIAAALRRREPGVDVLALIAIGGALALHQELTAAVIGLMLAGGRLLESYAERRAGREMAALLARVPRSAQRYAGGVLHAVPLGEIAVGDRLLVRHGEVLAVDGTLAGEHAVLDESALTGEAQPLSLRRGAALRSGAVNAGNAFDMLATATAAGSTYAGIVALVEAAQRATAPATRLADRYAFWFVPLSLALAAAAWLISGDALRALAVVVVATPCPLLLAVPVAIVSGISRCARRGVLIKGGAALEALAAARILFFDKTGTLTGGQARLTAIHGVVSGGENDVLRVAASLEQLSNHVIASAVVRAAQERALALTTPTAVEEVPGAGVSGVVDGRRVAAGSLDYVERIAVPPPAWRELQEQASGEGMSTVWVAVDGEFSGVLLLADQLRMETPRALRLLRRAGIRRIAMLTGDRRDVAETIGAGLGVDEVIAECTAAGKLDTVRAASADAPTMMVGDGINDAPALAAAGVGVAMGSRGATAAAEAAGVVLLVDRLDRLAEAVHIAHRTRVIALQSVFAGMGLALVAMALAAVGWLPPLYGALVQEAIDVAVILNALRALRIQPLRAARLSLPPAELSRLRDEHHALAPVLDRLTAVADRLPALSGNEAMRALADLDALLRDQLLPHESEDDRHVYPAVAALLGGDDPLAAMSRTHREIFRLHRQLGAGIARLDAAVPDPDARRDVQRTLYALDAILRLHFAQEEEIYQSLARD